MKNKGIDSSENQYTVWVGAVEVNDYLMTKDAAKTLAMEYIDDGYDDVYIENCADGTFFSIAEELH